MPPRRRHFSADEFRPAIEAEARRVATEILSVEGEFVDIEPSVIDALVEYLRVHGIQELNEDPNLERMLTDRLVASVSLLMADAAKLAALRHQHRVGLSELEVAYKTHFCKVWPLCYG